MIESANHHPRSGREGTLFRALVRILLEEEGLLHFGENGRQLIRTTAPTGLHRALKTVTQVRRECTHVESQRQEEV